MERFQGAETSKFVPAKFWGLRRGPHRAISIRAVEERIGDDLGDLWRFTKIRCTPSSARIPEKNSSKKDHQPSSSHQAIINLSLFFLGYVYAFSKPCWTSDTGCSCARIISKSLKKWKHPVNPERRQVASWQNPGRGWGWYPSN